MDEIKQIKIGKNKIAITSEQVRKFKNLRYAPEDPREAMYRGDSPDTIDKEGQLMFLDPEICYEIANYLLDNSFDDVYIFLSAVDDKNISIWKDKNHMLFAAEVLEVYKNEILKSYMFALGNFDNIVSEVKCKRCQANKVIIISTQLRKADEGSTTVYSCRQCGNVWK